MQVDNDNIWETSLEIKNGVYAYKFIKNGQWILDPKNPAKIKSGNYENSKLEVKGCDSIIKGQNLKEGFSLGKIDKNFDGNSMEVVVAFDPSKISASSISVKVNRVLQKKNIVVFKNFKFWKSHIFKI